MGVGFGATELAAVSLSSPTIGLIHASGHTKHRSPRCRLRHQVEVDFQRENLTASSSLLSLSSQASTPWMI